MRHSINYSIVALLTLCITSCSDDANETLPIQDPNIKTYKGTQSPGDVWDWTINDNDNTFSAEWDYGTFDDKTDDITVEGTFTTLPSGFMKCIINSVDPANPEVPADGSAWFYAINLPDMAMLIKPEGSIKGDLIAAVAAGDCVDVPGEYNFFNIAPGNGEEYDPNVEDAYGRVTFLENTDGKFEIHGDKYSLDCANEGPCTIDTGIQDSPAATCTANGSVTITNQNGETAAEGQFTNAGVMIMDNGKGNGGVLALDKFKSFSIDELVGLEFKGFAYLPSNNDDKSVPVNMVFDLTNNAIIGTGRMITNIETGTLDESGVSLRFDSNDQGIWLGQMTHVNGLSTYFVTSFLTSNDKKIMVVSSTSSPDNSPFILVLISK